VTRLDININDDKGIRGVILIYSLLVS